MKTQTVRTRERLDIKLLISTYSESLKGYPTNSDCASRPAPLKTTTYR